ncbi:UPF0415 protein C7orf25 homolog isoform X2 [Hydractinia symbiolongicarpus]|nr:UPF0415 protein C7orf25 homolog isoform X2 [Hydractinia symbiolongicarpus]
MDTKLTSMIKEAEQLWVRSKELTHIPGASKLERKINAELKCLQNFKKGKMKDSLENHLKSTNLTNLRAVLKAVENSPDVLFVLKSFYYETELGGDQLVVDAVVTGGYKWIKIIARKPLAVHKIWNGEGQYGDKDIVEIAKEYIIASDQNPINYEIPSISFVFPRGVTKSVHNALKSTGVCPIGRVLPDPDMQNLTEWQKLAEAESNMEDITQLLADFTVPSAKVNLDITTLIVLTSNITNGDCNLTFLEDILTKQAEEERAEPALPKLQQYLAGKELICCQTAHDNFQEILNTVGGPQEKLRSEALFKTVAIVPDEPAVYAMELEESASVKLRSKIIFGTGETLQAITTTANTAFVRAASNQGVKFSSYFHPSRALTEQKQCRATPLKS